MLCPLQPRCLSEAQPAGQQVQFLRAAPSFCSARSRTVQRPLVAVDEHIEHTRTYASASTPAESSFDAEDELDSGPSRELSQYDVERFRRQSDHLELMWKIQRVSSACVPLWPELLPACMPVSSLCSASFSGLRQRHANAASALARGTVDFVEAQVC